ncbi:uncharacterized protein SCHCODRAFT_02640292 [Schizophyllum commune H4-8]|nr:uncharacterized protein SCHCODRAFT_02640292 [Schizophyllum commune H4-8]KAI5886918.1 hypothetical protein SCHCODRAFT_02640292 [Schizophyllum commune H4-8]
MVACTVGGEQDGERDGGWERDGKGLPTSPRLIYHPLPRTDPLQAEYDPLQAEYAP